MKESPVYSFVFDRVAAKKAFAGVDTRTLCLALLAGITPPDGWDGCEVFEGESPVDPAETGCVATQGPGADAAQQALVEAFERVGVPVGQLYEGGPSARQEVARALGGRWVHPEEAGASE